MIKTQTKNFIIFQLQSVGNNYYYPLLILKVNSFTQSTHFRKRFLIFICEFLVNRLTLCGECGKIFRPTLIFYLYYTTNKNRKQEIIFIRKFYIFISGNENRNQFQFLIFNFRKQVRFLILNY